MQVQGPGSYEPVDDPAQGPSRRRVLVVAGVALGAISVSAACGSADQPQASASPSSAGESPSSAASAGAGTGISVPISDVPVGGGIILADQKVVLTQPAAGAVKGFSAVCTHQGCVVGSVDQGAIVCPCHGSRFSIEDGSVLGGPARAPLPVVPVSVSGDTITVG